MERDSHTRNKEKPKSSNVGGPRTKKERMDLEKNRTEGTRTTKKRMGGAQEDP